LNFADIDQVKAARNVIVTCEEIVDTEQLRDKPEYNSIPFIHVDAVVHVPFGAIQPHAITFTIMTPSIEAYQSFRQRREAVCDTWQRFSMVVEVITGC